MGLGDLAGFVLKKGVGVASLITPTGMLKSLLKSFMDMNPFFRSFALSFMGTFVPLSGLWFIHMIIGLILGSIVYMFFKTSSAKNFFYAFLIGVAITSVVMFVFYYFISEVLLRTVNDILTKLP